jgi:hypothetical protein
MLGPSFRSLLARRVYPRRSAQKRFAAVLLAPAVLAAGCGGTTKSAEAQHIRAPRYSFDVPSGWQSEKAATLATRTFGRGESVLSVTVFPLVKDYRPALWTKAAGELDRATDQVAQGLHGRVDAARTMAVDGRRARSYDVSYKRDGRNLVERFTFLLTRRREFQLLCRWPADDASEGKAACEQLVQTFRLR